MLRPGRGVSPRRARHRSQGDASLWRSRDEAYPRSDRGGVGGAHALGTERGQALARGRGIGDERRDIDALARRRERAQALDAFLQQDARAVEVPRAPVMEANADLEYAVIQAAVRRAGVPPQQLERLVLLEEVA